MGQKLPNSFNQTIEHFKHHKECALIFIRDTNLKSVSQTLRDYKSSKFYKKDKDKLIKNYGIGAQIIKALNIKNMILVTRSKKKVVGLEGYGITITKQEIIKWKKKILIVRAAYYQDISDELNIKALETIEPFADSIGLVVPGVFEIPVIISKYIKEYDGFIALGCVIKGETPHFEFISQSSIDAIMKLSIEHKKPIGNGIITCLNKKQAIVRSKTKGQEAAKAVMEVLNNF